MTSVKRFVFILLLLFYSSTLLLSPALVSAQTPVPTGTWYNPSVQQFRDKVVNSPENDIFGERYTFAQVTWIIHSLFLMVSTSAGETEIRSILDQLTYGRPVSPSDLAKFGLPGLLASGITQIYSTPPASGIDAVQNTLARFDLATEAHAQGYGYNTLRGIQTLWTASRNMVYLITTILVIAAGFMVLFRVKINPQTAVTLQLMIPRIIFTLLLVTFSYAIAGFVIDLIYLSISIIIAALFQFGVFTPSAIQEIWNIFGGGGLTGVIRFFSDSTYHQIWLYYIVPWVAITAAGSIFAVVTAASLIGVVIGVVAAIIGLIFTVWLIWLLWKIWWMLLKTYIQLIITIILGPWQIMMGLLPGQGGFGAWLRNMIANASVFVVVPLMFFFNMLLWRPSAFNNLALNIPTAGAGGRVLQLITELFDPFGAVNIGVSGSTLPDLPFINGGGSFFTLILGYAILALTPKVADMVRDALKIPPFKYGTAFGEALGPLGFAGGAARAGGVGGGLDYLGKRITVTGGTYDRLLAGRPELQKFLGQVGSGIRSAATGVKSP